MATTGVPPTGQLRRLTIMFCDLVGSTAMSARHEPERYRQILGRYKQTCQQIVEGTYDGHIAKVKGDGLLVFFGHPAAHEDDVPRAVLAGLDLLAAMHQLSEQAEQDVGEELATRVAVHRGLVYLDPVEDDVYGLAANVAARLQELAPPGSLVVSEEVRDLLGDRFETEPQEPQKVKGLEEPLPSWRVVGERTEPTARWRRWSAVTPLVGRQAEVAALHEAWRSRPGAVVLRGEPGIGKSRLAAALAAEVAEADAAGVVEIAGSALHRETGFHPLRVLIEQSCLMVWHVGARGRLRRLRRHLGRLGLDADHLVPLLGPVLGIDPAAGYPPAAAEGRKLADDISGALGRYLRTALGDGPALLLVDDGQWLDEATREVVVDVLRDPPAQLLVVVTTRSDGGWLPTGATVADLCPLSDSDGAALVTALDPSGVLVADRAALDALVARSDGMPLYLEELVRTAIQLPPSNGPGGLELPAHLAAPAVPDPLYEPLVARLHATPGGLHVAGAAATIGRQVDHALLAQVVDAEAPDLATTLTGLVHSAILVPDPSPTEPSATAPPPTTDLPTPDPATPEPSATAPPPTTEPPITEPPTTERPPAGPPGDEQRSVGPTAVDPTWPGAGVRYRFRHELLREVAYELQPPSVRRQLHGRLADALTPVDGADGGAADWRVLAHHNERAERSAAALECYERSADEARRRGALAEARADLDRAIDLLWAIPAGAGAPGAMGRFEGVDTTGRRERREIGLRLRRGFLAVAAEGNGSPTAAADHGRCLELATALADDSGDAHFTTLTALWGYYASRGDLGRARQVSETLGEALDDGRRSFRPVHEAGLGMLDWFGGRFREALDQLERAAAAADDRGDDRQVRGQWFLPNDPRVAVSTHLGIARFMAGDPGGARQAFARSEQQAAALPFPQGPFSAAYNHTYAAWVHGQMGELDVAEHHVALVQGLAAEHGFDFWAIAGATQRAEIDAARARQAGPGDRDPAALATAAATLGGLVAAWQMIDVRVFLTTVLTSVGATLAAAGQVDAAADRLAESLRLAEETGCNFHTTETLRVQAALVADAGEAEQRLRDALAMAKRQGAVAVQLRIARDLGVLPSGAPDARSELAEVLDLFAPGASYPELDAARALLA